MIEKVRLAIIDTLARCEAFLIFSESTKLHSLSDSTIKNAAIYQDQDSLKVAIIIYSLSKLIERGHEKTQTFSTLIHEARSRLEGNRVEEFEHTLAKLLDTIAHADSQLGLYVQEVIEQAKVKKGSRLLEQGFSLGQSAYLLGLTQWELMHYVGKTIQTEQMPTLDVATRLKFTRSIFK